MLVNWGYYIKAKADQDLLDRSKYEVIQKGVAKEYLLEDANAFLEFITIKRNGIANEYLTFIQRNIE